MKKKRTTKSAVKQNPVSPTNNEADSLREYVLEAEQVELLKKYNGWAILERDLNQYRDEIGCKIAYLDPRSKVFTDARIQYIAADKLLKMMDDYAENRKRALELLDRIDNQKENIVLDVDNG